MFLLLQPKNVLSLVAAGLWAPNPEGREQVEWADPGAVLPLPLKSE